MTIEQKFKRGDRVTINPEAVIGLEHLFPKGFETFNGTVTSHREDWHYNPYPVKKVFDIIYSVRMDQDISIPNISFATEDITLLLSADIVALDKVIAQMQSNLDALKDIRCAQAAYREKG